MHQPQMWSDGMNEMNEIAKHLGTTQTPYKSHMTSCATA